MEVDPGELPPLLRGPEHHSMSTDQEAPPTTDKLPTLEISEEEPTAKPDSWEHIDSEAQDD